MIFNTIIYFAASTWYSSQYTVTLVVTSQHDASYELEVKKVLIALALAKAPAPLGYIADRTGIDEPLPTVERLEAMGWVRRCPSSQWSCTHGLHFEVRPEVLKELWAYL